MRASAFEKRKETNIAATRYQTHLTFLFRTYFTNLRKDIQ